MADTSTVKIKVTPTDRQWLRVAAEILDGKRAASDAERKTAARQLYRLDYRADLASG